MKYKGLLLTVVIFVFFMLSGFAPSEDEVYRILEDLDNSNSWTEEMLFLDEDGTEYTATVQIEGDRIRGEIYEEDSYMCDMYSDGDDLYGVYVDPQTGESIRIKIGKLPYDDDYYSLWDIDSIENSNVCTIVRGTVRVKRKRGFKEEDDYLGISNIRGDFKAKINRSGELEYIIYSGRELSPGMKNYSCKCYNINKTKVDPSELKKYR